jgi:low temperature requirement protein LtrA
MIPPTATLPHWSEGRKATWFELFFDLAFVVAVAQLSAAYAHHYTLGGAAVFALAFLAMWWCWLGHTFHATRFDDQSLRLRLLGFAQIGATALMGYGASDPLGERAWAFGGALALFKLTLAFAYWGERRWPGAHGLIRVYARLYCAQAALWVLGLVLGLGLGLSNPDTAAPGRAIAWGAALLLDLLSPWLVARHTASVPLHPEHLPERFGLFTIILLGEGLASVVHALDHGPQLQAWAMGSASMGAVLSFGLWQLYFERVKGQGERHVTSARAGARMRLWAYGHVPLYLGIASLAAGTVALAAPGALSAGSAMLYLIGLALAGLSLALLGRATSSPH